MSEIYQSSTHGNIPLSFTGRRLLANLREAIEKAISWQDYDVDGKALSKARGEIAKRMSELESRQFDCDWGDVEARALAAAMCGLPKWRETREPQKQAADEFLEAAREYNEARAKLTSCAKRANDLGLKTTWINKASFAPRNIPKQFDKPYYFQPLTFEVSRIVPEARVVMDEHVEVMGREPK